jgi:hypothetical protein
LMIDQCIAVMEVINTVIAKRIDNNLSQNNFELILNSQICSSYNGKLI